MAANPNPRCATNYPRRAVIFQPHRPQCRLFAAPGPRRPHGWPQGAPKLAPLAVPAAESPPGPVWPGWARTRPTVLRRPSLRPEPASTGFSNISAAEISPQPHHRQKRRRRMNPQPTGQPRRSDNLSGAHSNQQRQRQTPGFDHRPSPVSPVVIPPAGWAVTPAAIVPPPFPQAPRTFARPRRRSARLRRPLRQAHQASCCPGFDTVALSRLNTADGSRQADPQRVRGRGG
jgi:hypothetical protein